MGDLTCIEAESLTDLYSFFFILEKKMGTMLLREEQRSRLRLEARIRELEDSVREFKEENVKLKGRMDAMASVYPELSKNTILEWASVLRAKDDEIRRLRDSGSAQQQPTVVVRANQPSANSETTALRAELDAAHARIRQLELLLAPESEVRLLGLHVISLPLTSAPVGHRAPQDGG